MEITKAILINLVVPALGFWFYWKSRQRMQKLQIADPPNLPLLLMIVSYGGWLMVILTGLFGYWSGMATLGMAYLLFVAPVLMLLLAYRLWSRRHQSEFHFGLFIGSAVYIVLPASVFLLRAVLMHILP